MENEKRHRFTGDRLAGCDRLWLSGFWMFLALRFIMVYRFTVCRCLSLYIALRSIMVDRFTLLYGLSLCRLSIYISLTVDDS